MKHLEDVFKREVLLSTFRECLKRYLLMSSRLFSSIRLKASGEDFLSFRVSVNQNRGILRFSLLSDLMDDFKKSFPFFELSISICTISDSDTLYLDCLIRISCDLDDMPF